MIPLLNSFKIAKGTSFKIILHLCYSKITWIGKNFQGMQYWNWLLDPVEQDLCKPLNLLIFIKPRFVSGSSGLGVLSDLKVGRPSLWDDREGIGIFVKLELFGCSPLIIINDGRSRNRNVTFMDYFFFTNDCWDQLINLTKLLLSIPADSKLMLSRLEYILR